MSKRFNRVCVLGSLFIALLPEILLASDIPAFPGAEGFGGSATGGRGGQVVFVTSTDDDVTDPKPGTFRYAIEKVHGPHYVIFRTGGKIQINKPLRVSEGDVTIAAQTAPGSGICLTGGPLCVYHADNVIIRGLRSRPGDGPGVNPVDRDGLQIDCSHNVIFDHCSESWSVDESMDINDYLAKDKHGDSANLTVQWCLFAEGLDNSVHGIDPGDTSASHSCGPLVWGKSVNNVSMHHNLVADCDHRNPRLSGGVSLEWVNNVVYNWGSQALNYDSSKKGAHAPDAPPEGLPLLVNVIGNVYLRGPKTNAEKPMVVGPAPSSVSKLYLADNLSPGLPKVQVIKSIKSIVETPAFPGSVKAEPADQIQDKVLAGVGALLPQRDSVDTRIVQGVKTNTGKVIDSQKDVGGWPDYPAGTPPVDTDNDGMPDDWEIAHHLDPKKFDANGHNLDKVYDNVEVYLNGLFTK